ncbi:MAG: hypothetical protein IBX68_02500 [Dehalococcoidia bacterium]|nr:hypothetical protein [Dehalococcoidia bacterium]
MDKGNNAALWRQKFKRVKDGLDEEQVFSSMNSLIEQNSQLTARLEHLDSLTKLAENTVIEADRLATAIRQEIEQNAREQAASTVAEAEEKAAGIVAGANQAKEAAERAIAEGREKARLDAESVVAKARTEAEAEKERILAEARQTGDAILQEETEKAEQQAEMMLKAAEEQATAAVSRAEKQARTVLDEAAQKIRAAEEQTQQILAETQQKAEEIEQTARDNAARLIAESEQEAEDLRAARIAAAEEEARNILKEATEKAHAQAMDIRREAQQILVRSKQVGEEHIKDKFRRVYESLITDLAAGSLKTLEEQTPHAPEPPAQEREELEDDEAVSQPVAEQEEIEPEDGVVESEPVTGPVMRTDVDDGLYQGTVEITITPPVGLDRMLQLHKNLRHIRQIEVLNLGVSKDKGITIRIYVENPVPLLGLLKELPEIEEIKEEPAADYSSEKDAVTRIIVSTRK